MHIRTISLVALVAALLLLNAGVVSAKKPVKPPPPPTTPADSGNLYFDTGTDAYSMDPDGTDKTKLATGVRGVPSESTHWCDTAQADERWFLQVRQMSTGAYPNGVSRRELFAVCESGHAIQLSNAADVEPDHTIPMSQGAQPVTWHARPQWADGDTLVSYVAKRWSSGSVVEWGFYVIAVDPDDLDSHTATAPTWIDVELDRMVPSGDTWSGGRVNAINAWAVDGGSFIYSSYLSTGRTVMRADYDDTTSSWYTTELADGIAHCWAPVTDRILFKQDGAVVTMDPYDATDFTFTSIQATTSNQESTTVGTPRWSPSGTHIAYQRNATTRKGATSWDVYVALADGSSQTNLTGDTASYAELLGWGCD